MAKKTEAFVVMGIKYVTTHRGINAYANIYKGAQKVGTVEDIAERIVAPVFLNTPALHAEFLAAAKKAKFTGSDATYIISEYARKLITNAEGV